MSKPSRKKQERRDKRKKSDLARREKFSNRKAAVQQFPQMEVDLGTAPPPLANAIRRAVKRIQFENERLFSADLLIVLRCARKFGFGNVAEDFREMMRQHHQKSLTDDELTQLVLGFEFEIGQTLHSFLPLKVRQNYLTDNFIIVLCGYPSDDGILVRVRSLCQEKTAGGTAYYSPNKPTVQTDGGEKIVAFSRHALERIYERTVLDWDTYGGNCDAVGFILTCNHFEPCVLPGSDHAFSFYNLCATPDLISGKYARAVLGPLDDDKDYYYRLGYCPAAIAGDFLVAKTLLLPGMNKTPEFERILRRQVPSHDEQLALRKKVNGLTLKSLATTLDFSLIQQFHQAGIPQVVSFEQTIFCVDPIFKRGAAT